MSNRLYINSSQVSFSTNDFVIECGLKKDRKGDASVKPEDIDIEIYMSPQYAKIFSQAVSKAISVYEEMHGEINLHGKQEIIDRYIDNANIQL